MKAHKVLKLLLALALLGCQPIAPIELRETAKAAMIAKPAASISCTQTVTSSRPVVTPWIEINSMGFQYANGLCGIRSWFAVVDEVCVSSMPSVQAEVYAALARDMPHLNILPGVKTYVSLQRRIDNVPGWKTIAGAVREACDLTGSDRCLIENETGWKAYIDGDYEPNWQRVVVGLGLLPKDILYVWYPGVWGNTEEKRNRSLKFMAAVVKALPEVTVASHGWAQRYAPDDLMYQRLHQMDKSLGVPLTMLAWFYSHEDRPQDWDVDSLLRLLEGCPEDTLLLYPGWRNWVETSQLVGHALHELVKDDLEARWQQMAAARSLVLAAAEQLKAGE